MKSLLDYDVITNEVFYKCWHILEYIEKHPDMSELDKEAIQATIMDALVYKKLIDSTKQSLDLENLSIVDDLGHYKYEKNPRICGIPLWMKEEFRKKSIYISAGIPISIFLSKPPNKFARYCVYDPNSAVSSIFEDANFYNCYYDSPTRGVRIEEQRPFVEVKINGENYLVDTLTKRILKSSWFKPTYNFKATSCLRISKFNKKNKKIYKNQIREHKALAETIPFLLPNIQFDVANMAEMKYEVEQSKKYFPEEWERAEILKKEMEDFFAQRKIRKINE